MLCIIAIVLFLISVPREGLAANESIADMGSTGISASSDTDSLAGMFAGMFLTLGAGYLATDWVSSAANRTQLQSRSRKAAFAAPLAFGISLAGFVTGVLTAKKEEQKLTPGQSRAKLTRMGAVVGSALAVVLFSVPAYYGLATDDVFLDFRKALLGIATAAIGIAFLAEGYF